MSILLYMAWRLILYKDAVLVQKCVFIRLYAENIVIQSDNQVFLFLLITSVAKKA